MVLVYCSLLTYDSKTSSILPHHYGGGRRCLFRHHCRIEHKSWNLGHIVSFWKPWHVVNIISMLFKTPAEHLTRLKGPLSSWMKAPQFGKSCSTEWRWFVKISICCSNWLEYVFSWGITSQQWHTTKALHSRATSAWCLEFINTQCTCMYIHSLIPTYTQLMH